jgi:hypothetical protein
MSTASIFYPIIFFVLLYFLFKNTKNRMSYQKENMEVLLLLDEDDKRVHLMSRLLMAVMILITGIMIRGLIETKTYSSEDVMIMAVLPIGNCIVYTLIQENNDFNIGGTQKVKSCKMGRY